mgnify:CR=1 FL=1
MAINTQNVILKISAGEPRQLLKDPTPQVAFSGRSNVGKSSLINSMLGRKSLARVSATPGKTGTINFFKVGNAFNLVDSPGYGYAKVSDKEKMRWAELVEGYFAQDRKFALVVQIVDMRHKATDDDMHMISFLENSGLPYIIVLTKKDKLNKTEQAKQLEALKLQISEISDDVEMFPFSALKGDGIEEIRQAVSDYIENFDME